MPDRHFTAWLCNDLTCLDTPFMDITVFEDKLIGENPQDRDSWAPIGGKPAFYDTTDVEAADGSIDDAQKDARLRLEAAGWRVVNEWQATPSAYTATVERADDEPEESTMTAADHIKAAQDALELSDTYRQDGAHNSADRCLREAQVHATLADVLDRREQRPCLRCGCVRNCECDEKLYA